jgi:hypothetical protein
MARRVHCCSYVFVGVGVKSGVNDTHTLLQWRVRHAGHFSWSVSPSWSGGRYSATTSIYVPIEVLQIFRGDPVLLMETTPHLVDWIPSKTCGAHCTSGYVATLAVSGIPVSGNLDSIFLEQDRIEDRLPGQSWRKCRVTTGRNQGEFMFTGRAVECCGLWCPFHHVPRCTGEVDRTITILLGLRPVQSKSVPYRHRCSGF